MFSIYHNALAIGAISFLLLSSTAQADFVLYSNYEFEGDLSDSLGNSADFATIGSPTFSSGSLIVGETDGLSLSTMLTASDYRIEIDFTFSALDRWNKLLDFEGRSSDIGLYVGPGPVLNFYTVGSGSTQLSTNIPYTIGLEKTEGAVIVDLDGIQQFTFSNIALATSTINSLVFFADDFATNVEGTDGSVDSIRFYVTAVPEPSSLILMLAGISALALKRKRMSL